VGHGHPVHVRELVLRQVASDIEARRLVERVARHVSQQPGFQEPVAGGVVRPGPDGFGKEAPPHVLLQETHPGQVRLLRLRPAPRTNRLARLAKRLPRVDSGRHRIAFSMKWVRSARGIRW
jgi:hypothetical protein